ncbi:MAG TPA: hypothetical protein VL475_09735 [Planctomycetaceae bacterium]|nr:hypothetical protein [Planctomycetaceae bacterium]
MLGRFVVVTAGLLLAFTAWAWSREDSIGREREPAARAAAIPGTCYAVDVSGPATTIDLPSDLADECDLIVSSLGDSDRTFQICLSSAPTPGSVGCALHEVPALRWSRWPVENTAAPPDDLSPRTLGSVSKSQRTFHLHVADTPLEDRRGYTRVSATLLGEGRLVRVYGDDQLRSDELAEGLVDEIMALLDDRVIPRSRTLMGVHQDIDGDGKLAILLTPWLGRLQGGRTSVNGFVRSGDFQTRVPAPFGNHADVLYLNSAVRPGPELTALLAHEYTHAVCCSLRLADRPGHAALPDEPDWLNEAIAHVAEALHGAGWSNLDHRVQSFLENPQHTPVVVRDYYRAGLWRDPACRGATFLFLQWCIQCCGEGLLRELACDPRTGVEKLEALTGQSFPTLYRHWTIALHRGRIGTIDLGGRLGECQLAGVHRLVWNSAEQPLQLELRGTATAFVRQVADFRQVRRRIVITSEPGARLQVTIVRPVPGRTVAPSSAQVALRPEKK